MIHIRQSKRWYLPLLAVLLNTQACIEEKDFDIEGVKLQPSVAVPFLYGNLSIEDMLPAEASSYVEYDADKLIHLVFSDTLVSTSIHDYFLLPTLILNESYPVGIGSIVPGSRQVLIEDYQELDFGFSEADFKEIILKTGSISLEVSSNVNAEVDLEVSFPTIDDKGTPLTVEETLPAGENSSSSININPAGLAIDFSGFGTGENKLPVLIKALIKTDDNSTLDVSDQLDLNLVIADMGYSLLSGYLGQAEVDLPSGTFALESLDQIFEKGNFSLHKPLLKFDILNSNGIPVQVKVNTLDARSETNETIPIQIEPGSPFNINYPTEYGKTALTSLNITNVGEVMGIVPSFIDYQLSGRLNTGESMNLNFLTDKSKTSVVVHADIPLWGHIEGITLSESFNMPLELEDALVEEASIRIHVENEFPLEAQLQILFVDENSNIVETLFENGFEKILEPATVNEQGDLVSAGIYHEDIVISSTRFERILKSDKMIINGTLQSRQNADGSFPNVKIKSDYDLNVSLGVKSSVNITVTE